MKTYNEIYPIEGWADKISKHLGKIADEKPNMYAKTKRRYQVLADSLLDSVAKIAIILEEDSLVSQSTDEFDELSSRGSDLNLTERIQQLNKKFHQAESFSGDAVEPSRNVSNPGIYSNTIDHYNRVFQEASVTNFGYSEVNECARMLHKWFKTRFKPDVPDYSFRFNIRYMSTWVCNFIILYGKYHHEDRSDQFVHMIERWCDDVSQGTSGNYAIPYPIYILEKESNPADYTIDAVVINDILSNACLYKLSEYESSENIVTYDHNVLVTVVKDRNPSLHSKIVTRIAKRKELIAEIGLTPVGLVGGNDSDE